MAEPLLGHPALAARVDDDLDALVVTGRLAGPAGAASLALGELTVDLDVAEPAGLVGVYVPRFGDGTVPPASADLLAALLGEARARALARHAASTDRRALRLSGRNRPSPGRSVGDGVDARLQRLALAASYLDRPGTSPFADAVAGLTVAVETARLGRSDVRPATPAAAVEMIVDELDRRPAESFSDGTRVALAGLLADAADLGLVPDHDAPVRFWAERLRPSRWRPAASRELAAALPAYAASAPAPRAGTRPAPVGRLRARLTVAPESLPGPLVGRPLPTAAWLDDGNIGVDVVSWPRDAPPLWARAFRPGTDLLVATAPVLPQRRDARALLLVPPQLAVELDVVLDPRAPRPSRALAASALGFAHGRDAARQERLDAPYEAAEAWRASGVAHAEAGDDTRSAAARARAAGRRYGAPGVVAALVSDHLHAEGVR